MSVATAILIAVAVGGAVGEGVGKRPSFFERGQPLEPHVSRVESVETLSHLGPGLGVPLSARSILGQLWFMAYEC